MKKPTLTIFTDWYWPKRGGVEMVSQTIASKLRSDFEINVITHGNNTPSSLYSTFSVTKNASSTDPAGNRIKTLGSTAREKVILLPLLLWQIKFLKKPAVYDRLYTFYRLAFRKKIINQITGSDLVHCISTNYTARAVSEICREVNIPLLQSPFIHFGKWGDSPSQLDAYKSSDILICPTESFRKKLVTNSVNTIHASTIVIPPPVNDPPENVVNKTLPQNYVLFLGRREAHKGLPSLIYAMKNQLTDHKLIIAGPGTKISPVETNILDLGEIDDTEKHDLLSNCALLCVPSSDETFGLVYVEAMSYGKPVIALNIAPVNEIVESGKEGILVPPDNPEQLAFALRKLLTDSVLRKKMGNAARLRFQKDYSEKVIIERYRTLYHELLNKV